MNRVTGIPHQLAPTAGYTPLLMLFLLPLNMVAVRLKRMRTLSLLLHRSRCYYRRSVVLPLQ